MIKTQIYFVFFPSRDFSTEIGFFYYLYGKIKQRLKHTNKKGKNKFYPKNYFLLFMCFSQNLWFLHLR